MSGFDGFTFSAAAGVTAAIPKSQNPKLDMDLSDVVKQDLKSRTRPSTAGRVRGPKGAKPSTKPKESNTPRRKDAADKPEKRSYDLNVPEGALRDILTNAGIDVPDLSAVMLVAKRRDK
jgi:hypothetical protein